MAPERDEPFEPSYRSLDLEVGKEDGRIHALGAVRGETGHGYHGGGPAPELTRLDALAYGASFLLGHNLIAFDLPYLKAAKPDLRLLGSPVIDTLRLSLLAFPSNPYQRLVKHYHASSQSSISRTSSTENVNAGSRFGQRAAQRTATPGEPGL